MRRLATLFKPVQTLSRREHSRMASAKLARPVHLVLDYDGTLTVKDTMAVLGDLPKQPKMTWQEIVDAYIQDYAAYKETPYPWKKYDRTEYSGWLAARKWVEQKSAQRVQDAEFFKGVTFDEMEASVKKHLAQGTLQLRQGWVDIFKLFTNSNESKISIVSVNWSATSIRLALLHAGRRISIPEQDRKTLLHLIETIEIHANEIDGLHNKPEGSSGKVCGANDIRTSDDKLLYLPKSSGPDRLVVYAGDSSTDFDCLCAADIGVWLYDVPEESGRRQKFGEVFSPFDKSGFYPPPLSSLEALEAGKELFYWTPGLEPLFRLLVAG